MFTPDKTKESFETNLTYLVAESADVQSDSHKSYSGLRNIFHSHEMVNHRKEWVRPGILRPVTTNTIESFHSALKRQARNSNLLAGRSSSGPFLSDKVQEGVWRFKKTDEDML